MTPRDHQDVLAELSPGARAALYETSDLEGLVHLAGHLAVIVILGSYIALRLPLWPLLLMPQGIALVFLFTLAHEATHRTPFASDRLNSLAGHAVGFVLLLPFHWFRAFHMAHHRWTNLEGKDPELAGGKPASYAGWLWHVSGLPYWGGQIALIARLIYRADDAFIATTAKQKVVTEAQWMVVGYVLAGLSLLVTPILLWVWIVPVLLGQPFLRIYLLAEHGDCAFVANMLENTRTTFTNAIVRFFAWNMPYHAEHHIFPQVPFHRLPDLHRMIAKELKVTAKGYREFTRDYLSRRP
jgi:fatty acid desaturase